MMFSATLSKEIRAVCKKLMTDPVMEVFIDDESNQVIIFVKSTARAQTLNKLLCDCNFPSVATYGRMKQEERIEVYRQFKNFEKRILVSTDLMGRGVDIEKVNIVINYDMPESSEHCNSTDSYLH